SRYGDASSMDEFTYHYISGTNKLEYVEDGASSINYSEDIDNQSSGNYVYTQIGELKSDVAEGIERIDWRVDKKIRKIFRDGGSNASNVAFEYDAFGNRILKIEIPTTGGVESDPENWIYTYYARDAAGNVMSIYKLNTEHIDGDDHQLFKQIELPLYGSSRLGQNKTETLIADYNLVSITNTVYTPDAEKSNRILANKFYEFSNHLGNVLLVTTDRRMGIDTDVSPDGIINYYQPDIVQESDYYPFGMLMPGRHNSYGDSYRYGFNGME